MKNPKILIIGAGARGGGYATYFREFPDRGQVVGVAEPRAPYRERLAAAHAIPADHVFSDWQDVAARPRFADAVIIATQDRMHTAPAIAFAQLGYHILLEKPMAPTPEECHAIVDAVKAAGVLFGVCHVMRYTRYTQRLKALLESGALGDLVSIEHLEPVGFWHQAHSFVRGNWGNEAASGPMLLTKSCHDMDWLSYVMDAPCESLASFGTLKHFRKAEQPQGASDRCLDCAVEADCPYSAKRIYLTALERGHLSWPLDILTPHPTLENVLEALRTGPYGRCVYACDNDVVDHQVVAMQFAGGRTASFTMTAFTKMRGRDTRLFGTRGELTGDGRYLHHYNFMNEHTETIDTEAAADTGSSLGGHGGGDYWLMHHFSQALLDEDQGHILSGPDETLASHLMVFAAEQARKEQRVVTL